MGAMVVTSVIQSFSVHINFTVSQRIGMRARSTIAMTVFDKVVFDDPLLSFCLQTGIMMVSLENLLVPVH